MKDPWRGEDRGNPGPTPDDEDALGPLPLWHLNCPGGRVTVRSADARDEFGGLLAVARLLRRLPPARPTEPQLVSVLPGEVASPPASGLRLSASRGAQVIAVYAVNVSATTPAERERGGMRLVFEEVRRAVQLEPRAARDLGVSLVIR